jgi:uroporphyrinogen decarboxylase
MSHQEMSSLQRVRCVLAGEIPDRVPISLLSFQSAARFAGTSVGDYCLDGRLMAEAQLAYWEEFRHDVVDVENGVAALAEGAGCMVEYPDAEPPWVRRPALESLEQVQRLPPVELQRSPGTAALLDATARVARRLGRTVCVRGESDQGPFSLAAALYGPQRFLEALLDPTAEPGLRRLLEYAREQVLALARAQAAAGSHYTLIGDSLAGPDVCSPEVYRRFALPYERELIGALAEEGFGVGLHICGNATSILPDMLESGAAYFELDHKVDLEEAARLIAGRVPVFGTVDPVGVLEQGDPGVVEAEVRRVIRGLGPFGRLVLAPGCTLPWGTPFENIRAFVEAGRRWGVYDRHGRLVEAAEDCQAEEL